MEPVVDLVPIFPGNSELPEIAALADRDQNASGAERGALGEVDGESASRRLDARGVRGQRANLCGLRLAAELVDERLLHVGRHL